MQRRREKGLCFNCDEKFVPGHKCKAKQAFMIEPCESDEEGSELTEKVSDATCEDGADISVHAIAGTHGPRTLNFMAYIRNRRIVVLIDNGSSHNFINTRLTTKLNLTTTEVDAL